MTQHYHIGIGIASDLFKVFTQKSALYSDLIELRVIGIGFEVRFPFLLAVKNHTTWSPSDLLKVKSWFLPVHKFISYTFETFTGKG